MKNEIFLPNISKNKSLSNISFYTPRLGSTNAHLEKHKQKSPFKPDIESLFLLK